jgi:hypothetical protein
VSSAEVFEGSSGYLRWAPKAALLLAALVLWVGWNHALEWATLLVFIALLHGQCLAWRFVVSDDSVTMSFPFGRRVVVAKETVSVKMEMVGATLRVRGRLLRYLLFDGVLYRPGCEERLRHAFVARGFTVLN